MKQTFKMTIFCLNRSELLQLNLMFNGLLFLLGTAFEKLISRFEFLRLLRGWILVTLVKPAH